MSALGLALERVGGVFVSPTRTLRAIALEGAGRPLELVPIGALVAGIVEPIQLGRAMLEARVAPLDGLLSLLRMVGDRLLGPVLGALGFALLLTALVRVRRPELSLRFDAAFDAGLYALLPFGLLAALGGAMAEQGVELWFLPHRLLRGDPLVWLPRFVAGYGWSLGLGVLLVGDLLRGPGNLECQAGGISR